jgi:microcystin-dependent protein
MARLRLNFASGRMASGGINVGDTVLSSPQFAMLPVVASPDILPFTIDPDAVAGTPEVVYITACAGAGATSVTVLRGQEGTTARSHNFTSGVPQEVWRCSALVLDFLHANLIALTSDDHPQYLTAARHDTAGMHTGTTVLSDIVYPGVVWFHAGPASTVQPGWLICLGQAVSRITYVNLFNVIGTRWGAGDGSTTFNLPPSSAYIETAGSDGAVVKTTGALAHAHTVDINSSTPNVLGMDGHIHSFANGVEVTTGGTTANHGHVNVTAGSSTTAGQNADHAHVANLSGITGGGPTNGSTAVSSTHYHTTNGTSASALSVTTAGFYAIIKT